MGVFSKSRITPPAVSLVDTPLRKARIHLHFIIIYIVIIFIIVIFVTIVLNLMASKY